VDCLFLVSKPVKLGVYGVLDNRLTGRRRAYTGVQFSRLDRLTIRQQAQPHAAGIQRVDADVGTSPCSGRQLPSVWTKRCLARWALRGTGPRALRDEWQHTAGEANLAIKTLPT
jgi:hypothetical protein